MGEYWRQLKLLLRKNFLLRVRQPVILALELCWPICIFIAIMGARWTVPPVERPTCHYNAWALPSAGAVPFLQSLICNIDNECLNETEFRDIPSYPNSRIDELVDHLVPLLSDEKLLQFVEALPKGTRLARALLDTLSTHDLRHIITKGIPIKLLLKTTQDTTAFLEQYFPPELTTQILDSYIRLPQLLQITSTATSLCAPEDITSDFSFPSEWRRVQESFCTLNSSKQEEFFRELQKHLDVSNIVHMAGDIMSQLGRVDIGETISRIGTTVHQLSSRYLFPSLFSGNIQPLLEDVSGILNSIQAGHLDLNLLSLVADDTAPLYEGNNWSLLKTFVEQLRANRANANKNDSAGGESSSQELVPSNRQTSNQGRTSTWSPTNITILSTIDSVKKDTQSYNLVQTFGDWVETFMYILRLLPDEYVVKITQHKLFAMFRFFVTACYQIMKTSTKGDFHDFFDLAESVFFTIADAEKGRRAFEPEFWTKTLCNKTEFLLYLTIPSEIDPMSLQEFACNVSTTISELSQWWPLKPGKVMKSNKDDISNLVEMIGFLVNQKPKEFVHGPSSGIFRTKLLRMQLAFGDFVKHVSSKSNLTDSLTILLRVTHSVFPKSTTASNFISTCVYFVRSLAARFENVSLDSSGNETSMVHQELPVPAALIRNIVYVAAETAETAVWQMLDQSLLQRLSAGKEDYCKNGTEISNSSDIFCSGVSDLKLPSAIVQKGFYNLDINWNSVQSDLQKLENVIRTSLKGFQQLPKNKTIIPYVLSAVNAAAASLHIFYPKTDCPSLFFRPRTVNSTLCTILRFQHVQKSLNNTSGLLWLSFESVKENNNAFVWSTLSMLIQQVLDFKTNYDDTEQEILTIINTLRLTSQNTSSDGNFVDWDNHVRLIFSVVQLIGSRLESNTEEVRTFFHTVHSLVNLFMNRIQAISAGSPLDSNGGKKVIEVEDIFPDAPITQNLVKGLFPRLPEVLSTLFWTSLAQGKMHHLATESQKNLTIITKLLCNDTITDYLYNPTFLGAAQWDSLMAEVCSHPYFKVFEEILEDPDIQTLIFETDKGEDPIEWDNLKQSVMELTSLTVRLTKERRVDLAVLPSAHLWSELWANISSALQDPTVVTYIVFNSNLYPFCDSKTLEAGKITYFKKPVNLPHLFPMTNATHLSSALCSMTTEEFAEGFIRAWSKPWLPNIFKNNEWRALYDTFLNSTNLRPILQSLLGKKGYDLFNTIDMLLLSDWKFNNINTFITGFFSIAENVFWLLDMTTDGNSTLKLAHSQVPFIFEDFVSYAKSGQTMYLEDIIQNKTLMKTAFSRILVNSDKRSGFQKLLSIQAEYFETAEHRMLLTQLCSASSAANDSNIVELQKELRHLVCEHEPFQWVLLSQNISESHIKEMQKALLNLIRLYTEKFESSNLMMFINSSLLSWVRNTFEMTFLHCQRLRMNDPDWKTLRRPGTYFTIFRSLLQAVQTSMEYHSLLNKKTCPPTTWSFMWSQAPNKILDSIPDAEFLVCELPRKNISAAYSEFSKVANIRSLLSEHLKVFTSNWSAECSDSPPPWRHLAVSWLYSVADFAERLFKHPSNDNSTWNNVHLCAQNITNTVLFRDFSRFGNLSKQITKLVSGLSGSGTSQKSFSDIENEITSFILHQLPGYTPVSAFLNLTAPDKDTSAFLRNATSEYILRILEKSTLNLNWLAQQNYSTKSLKGAFCQRNSSYGIPHLEDILILPVNQEAVGQVLQFLCDTNSLEYLISRIDITMANKTLREAQEREFRSGRWFRELFATSSGILDDIVHLVHASHHISINPPTSSKELVDMILKISKTTAIQEVLDGLNKIIQKLKSIFGGSALLDYLQQILSGAQAFQSLQRLQVFKLNLKVHELFDKNVHVEQRIFEYLEKKHQLTEMQVQELMNSEVDIKKLFNINGKNDTIQMCSNVEINALPNDDNMPINVPYFLCDLIRESKAVISAEQLQDIILGKLIKNVGKLGFEGILSKAGIQLSEVNEMMELLKSASVVIPDMELRLKMFLSVLEPNMGELKKLDLTERGIAGLASPEALTASGEILCGKPLKTLQRKFSLLSIEGGTSEPKVDKKEIAHLSNEFCQNAYKQVLKLPGGPILWGFLKPVFRGKLLYSPKNLPAAKAVIGQLNTTIGEVNKYIHLLQAMAEGTTGLHYLERKKELLKSIQTLLNSKQMSKIAGFDASLVSGILGAGDWSKSWSGDATLGPVVLDVITLVGNISQCITLNRFIGFDSELELERAAMMLHAEREFIAAIVFLPKEDPSSNNLLPHHIKYKIRMDIDNVPSTKEIRRRWWHPYAFDNFFDDLRYFRGFIQLQELIDTSIFKLQASPVNRTAIMPFKKYLQQFPYPCHEQDQFGNVIKGSLSGIMTLSWIFLIAFFVRDKVLEKELFLQEILNVMGLNPFIAWLSWFLTGLTTISVSVFGIVVIMKWGGVMPITDPAILLLFMFEYAILLLCYCHLMSVLFEKASTAALMALLVYILSFFPFILFVTWELYFVFWHKVVTCLLVATSFCFGTLYLTRLEEQGRGVQWSNLWQSPIPDDQMNMGLALVFMAACSVIYLLAALVILKLKKGRNGSTNAPWYFLSPPTTLQENSADSGIGETAKNISDDDYKLRYSESVSIDGLRVVYSSRTPSEEKRAVSGLSLKLHEGQITTLLGHNGAGKTTTIKVLTGRLKPNSGSIKIYGVSIPENMSVARKLIGYCPQYNTLFGKLTVREHLHLFAQLKGILTGKQLEDDVEQMLNCLGLREKQSEWSENLSGGQRRRLCVGMAFVGGSRFIVLDEPTSSVDPLARRGIWDLIVQYKTGRTILLTTHHLDEADILSDHVAVLHKGNLLCSGSPLFLKSKFGSGYKLSLFTGRGSFDGPDEEDSGNASVCSNDVAEPKGITDIAAMDGNGLMALIQSFVRSASLLSNDGNHLVVSLPPISSPEDLKKRKSDRLTQLFQELDLNLYAFGFTDYALTSTSLEEVFLTLCNLEDAKLQLRQPKKEKPYLPIDIYPSYRQIDCACQEMSGHNPQEPMSHLGKWKYEVDSLSPSSSLSSSSRDHSIETVDGYHLVWNQFKSILKKRMWHTKRNWKTLFCSIIMPCIFISLAMALAVGRPARRPEPPVQLSPQLYMSWSTGTTMSFISSDNWISPSSKPLLDSLIAGNSPPSQTTCYDVEPGYQCGTNLHFDDPKDWCLCKDKGDCIVVDRSHLPIAIRTDGLSNHVFYNLTNQNLPQHLLSNYIKFIEKRYGGWSLMHPYYSKTNRSVSFSRNKKADLPIAKIWFDNSGYHAVPSYLNAFHNAVLKSSLPSKSEPYGITAYSHPIQISAEQLGQETLLQRLGEIGIAYVFLIGLSLIPSASAIYLVRESSMEEKRVQIAAGISPIMYWITHLTWDLLSLLMTTGLAAVVIYCFNLSAFVSRLNFSAVVLLILCFGWASITLMYVCTRFFKEGSLAFMVLFTTNIFLGLIIMLVVVSLHMFNLSSDAEQALYIVKRASLIFPQWSLLGGLTALAQNQLQTDIFQIFGQDTYANPFSWSLLLPNYLTLFLEGAFCLILSIAIEMDLFAEAMKTLRNWTFGVKKSSPKGKEPHDGLIQLQNISQVYWTHVGKNRAVKNVSLNIFRGECFGLVGANGAGKTTLFRILSGQLTPTDGSISIGDSVGTKKTAGFLGYCPQADALDDLLTPWEHLMLYAQIKGIRSSCIEQVVEETLKSFDLYGHLNCPVKALSGGTKRKLCSAIAMIGSPSVILLDEPTSGMDPASRRLVWSSITHITTHKQKAAVILSSHSIEECDILCSRIGIMVNGEIQCLGTPQELKSMYGDGITISFRAPNIDSDYTSVLEFIRSRFPTALLKGHHCNTVELSLSKRETPLSKIIEYLEEGAQLLGLQDIALNHTTLDQVFVGFVQQQSDGTDPTRVTVESDNNQNLPLQLRSFDNSAYGSDNSLSNYSSPNIRYSTKL